MKKTIYLLLFVSLAFDACKKETITEEYSLPMYYDYYPMSVGKWIEYDGDSILYKHTATGIVRDTVKYVLREEYESSFLGPDSTENFRIFVKIKYKGDSVFQDAFTWYVQRNGNFIDKTEENLRFQKLNFPIATGRTWDGSIYISEPVDFDDPDWELLKFYQNWEYSYEYTHQAENINSHALDSVSKVLEIDSRSKIHKTLVYEKYAKHIGMVEKEFWRIKRSTVCSGCTELDYDQAEDGYIIHLRLRDYN